MDGWARGKRGDGAKQAPVKRQAVGSEALLAKSTLLISKLTLKNELEIRELQSAVFRTLTLADSLEFVVQARAATKAYTDDAKFSRDNGGPMPKGELHVYAWEAITRVAVETADAPSDLVETVKQHRAESSDPELLGSLIYVCKIKKASDRGTVKIHIAGHPDIGKIIQAVVGIMVHTGAKERRGQAPQAGMARELQQLVEQLTAIVG